jgi:hypothetical protein
MSTGPSEEAVAFAVAGLRHRAATGRHAHHKHCIHNLTPEEQVAVRGRTVEWWTKVIGPLPEQIGPEDWEIEPPEFTTRLVGLGGDSDAG